MTRLWAEGVRIQVEEGADGAPVRFLWGDTWHEVSVVANCWRVRATWWLPEADAHREYVKLTTADGLMCTLYRDLRDGAWYCARVFD